VKGTFISWCNTTGTTSGTVTAYALGAHEFTPGFRGIRVARFLVVYVVVCGSFFVLSSFFLKSKDWKAKQLKSYLGAKQPYCYVFPV
jgi:hypothetical protein